ncbi:toll/interleukin-1 receptor domain-containing protein [Bacillus cereus]|uniref:toll/interleukin-1 receptor domain-containing protein n=1 Tax=Bacillus cereus TaxID=1396 RepID=UPI000B4B5ECC|nr:toll/interleukin-1 receptor domain-containing protein [Bacillus cereus]
MSAERKKVFISYSWDNLELQQWVLDLNNSLRSKGIISKIDKTITQETTTNLNTMMVQNMKNNDYIIVVLTENYAQKADSLQGGVGFETKLSLSILQENPKKLIFILRHKESFSDAFPFHLKGYYAINFSDDTKFEDKFEELLHRIYDVPLYEEAPIGDIPNLQPRKTILKEPQQTTDFSYVSIPSLNTVTDLDKEEFLFDNYKEINNQLEHLFQHLNKEDSILTYKQDTLNNKEHIYKLYIKGRYKIGVKIWLGLSYGIPSINFACGNSLDSLNDNTKDKTSYVVQNKNNKMLLIMGGISFSNPDNGLHPHDIIKNIWERHLSSYIK